MKKWYMAAMLFFTAVLIARGQDLTYKEVSGDEIYHYDYSISTGLEKSVIKVFKRHGNDTLEEQDFHLDHRLHTEKWVYRRFSDNTHVTAHHRSNKVIIKGVRDGEDVEDEYDLEEYSWIQLWPMNIGLEHFIKSDDESIKFWAFGTEKPGDLEMAKFVATKEGKEPVRINAKEYQAYRVNITVSGWKSMFWEGNFFFRDSDKRIILYDGEGAPGKPDSRTTLIYED